MVYDQLHFFRGAEDASFDASQYEFFGQEHFEEVELGGLEDEEEGLSSTRLEQEESLFHRQEVMLSFLFLIMLSLLSFVFLVYFDSLLRVVMC